MQNVPKLYPYKVDTVTPLFSFESAKPSEYVARIQAALGQALVSVDTLTKITSFVKHASGFSYAKRPVLTQSVYFTPCNESVKRVFISCHEKLNVRSGQNVAFTKAVMLSFDKE